MDIDSILKPYQRFGVHLGLQRIHQLLANLGNPHDQVAIIHVAGTNGKGSVCAYLSAVLTEAGYRVGCYTSPHLISWTERICLNQKPISSERLTQLLVQVQAAIPDKCDDSPTQFEVITAAAWLYFAQEQVDIAVIEVGLGGRLDATNVCDRPLATIITSISREHWQVLGPTLTHIATEKAGILKPHCPAIIGPVPPEAETVIQAKIQQLNCPVVWVEPAKLETPEVETSIGRELIPKPIDYIQQNSPLLPDTPKSQVWANYQGIKYPLPLLGEIQLTNCAIAIATLQTLIHQGWQISPPAIASGMAKTIWPGRLQWTTYSHHPLLIDGAHNPAAAQALRQYVDSLDNSIAQKQDNVNKKNSSPALSITWVMGILSTKDHADIFQALLRPNDRLYLVPVPDHSSADPEELRAIAQTICPELGECRTYPSLETSLAAAISQESDRFPNLIVLCGSLYLIGHFLSMSQPHSLTAF